MKVLVITTLLALVVALPAMAIEKKAYDSVWPGEYTGYIIYEDVNSEGEKIVRKEPVRYALHPQNVISDNDGNYKYRSYRIEVDRTKKEQSAKEKRDNEVKKINSAAYYPLYLD